MSKNAPAKTADFLLDVHTEPLPARFVAPALEQLKTNAEKILAGRVAHGEISTYGTLRHLVLHVAGVAAKGADKTERFKGPKEAAWKTPDGAFTPAAEGFARKYGVSAADLKPEGGVLYAEVFSKGEPAAALLRGFVPELLKSLQFPKFMTWEETGFKFGRPIRAITALHGDKVIGVELAGVKSGRAVYGHPTYAKNPLTLKDPSKHRKLLRDNLVLSDPAERRAYLLKQLETAAKSAGGFADQDEDLVRETVDMVEHPSAVVVRLRDEHLRLPAALLKLVMKKQLKFFPVIDAKGGLLPAFIGVRDGRSEGNKLVAEGYRRVLEARFNDAAFFFGRDCAGHLAARLPMLSKVTYQQELGSMDGKRTRVGNIASDLCGALGAAVDQSVVVHATRVAYADLVTDVVKEFPELQGTMGGVYARREQMAENVAVAIEQFYFPVAAKSPVPATAEAAVVSLAGKLDSLAGCFAVGLIPTGSADPYALRRQALGAVRIVIERNLSIDLLEAFKNAAEAQPVRSSDPESLSAKLADFVWGRATSYFEEQGFAVDEIRAVRAGALRDLPAALKRLKALQGARRDPSFEALAAAFKRASNILKQSKGVERGVVGDRARLVDKAELALYDAVQSAEAQVASRVTDGDYAGALGGLVSIKPHLDGFFENVMVMVDDEALKLQRLALLARLVSAFKRVADLSEIQTPAA